MTALLTLLTGRLGEWLVGLLGGLVAYLKGRADGRAAATAEAQAAEIETRRIRDEVDRSVARDSNARGRLYDRWSRD